MRNEADMMNLILNAAKQDERVRAVILNGSRANPNAPRDEFQDYDIVYIVREIDSFPRTPGWIGIFGERVILQTPESMRRPSGDGRVVYLMLFTDGNRIDLTLIPIEKREQLLENDSESILLIDKDGLLPPFPPASDRDYWTKPPTKLYYESCCNNFFWCLQNVAKGIARDELPYAMRMLHAEVYEELHLMIDWAVGAQNGFAIAPGKLGKYYKNYLSSEDMALYRGIYSDAEYGHIWDSVFIAAELFRKMALTVAQRLGYTYCVQDDRNLTAYLAGMREKTTSRP